MKAQMISFAISMLMKLLTPELIGKFAAQALDFIEAQVLGSASKVDDAIVLPIVAVLRSVLNIPDDAPGTGELNSDAAAIVDAQPGESGKACDPEMTRDVGADPEPTFG